MGFSVFTDGAICSHGYCHLLSVHVPVQVGGLTVYPGDLLHGDRNGVTIPCKIAPHVAHACAEWAATEVAVLECLKSGAASREALAGARAEQHRLVAAPLRGTRPRTDWGGCLSLTELC